MEISHGLVFPSPYAKAALDRYFRRGFCISSDAKTIPFTASKALTKELFPAPFGPMIAEVFKTLNLSVPGTVFVKSSLLSPRATKEIV